MNPELASHNPAQVQEQMQQWLASMEVLTGADIADAIEFVVPRPRRVAINEILIRPTEQAL